jgi:hypothetical protein
MLPKPFNNAGLKGRVIAINSRPYICQGVELLSPKRCNPRKSRATASTPHANHVANPDFIVSPPMGAASTDRMPNGLRPGSQFTRRVAIASESDAFQSPSGSIAIVTANTRAAVSLGRFDKRAASRHGSKPSRVNAVRTVSCVPTFSSPTAAKRNGLYSE